MCADSEVERVGLADAGSNLSTNEKRNACKHSLENHPQTKHVGEVPIGDQNLGK